MAQLIKEFSNPEFSILESRFPKAICTTCKVTMYETSKGKTTRQLPTMPNFLDVHLLRQSRNTDDKECFCFICPIAKQKSHMASGSGGRGVKKKSVVITAHNGLYASKRAAQVKTPDADLEPDGVPNLQSQAVQVCKICFAEILNEKTHKCNEKKAHENVVSRIGVLPEKVQDHILHKLLATKAKISNSTEDLRNVEMTLKTGGRNARVVLNPNIKQPVYFSEETLDNFVTNTGSFLLQNILFGL